MVRKSFARARRESPLAGIIEVRSLKTIPQELAERGFCLDALGLELDVMPYKTWQFYQKVFAASTMQTGCCTPWKMRVLTSG